MADAELAARKFSETITTPSNIKSSPLQFYGVQHEATVLGEQAGNWTTACATYQAIGVRGIMPSFEVVVEGAMAECRLSGPMEIVNLSPYFEDADLSGMRTHDLTPDGLLVIHTALHRRVLATTVFAQSLKTLVNTLVLNGSTVYSLVVIVNGANATHLSELAEAYVAEAGGRGRLHALIGIGSSAPSEAPVQESGVWLYSTSTGSAQSRTVLHVELTVPLSGAPEGTTRGCNITELDAIVSPAVRMADTKWSAAQVVTRWISEAKLSAPLGVTVNDILLPDQVSNFSGQCATQDCVAGQIMAEVFTYGPSPVVGGIDGHDGSDPTSVDSGKLVENRTAIGMTMYLEYMGGALVAGEITEADLAGLVDVSSCRGLLRGLTILRIIRASLSTPGEYFMQYSGLRFSYVAADIAAGRSVPRIVSAEVLDPETGEYEPLQRTKLYTIGMSNYVPLMGQYSPVLDSPLQGDSVLCFLLAEVNWPKLVADFITRRSPLNYTVERRMNLLDADDPVALSAGDAGLLAIESPAICAERNLASTAPAHPALVYDADLLSCAPCPGHLVPNPAADTCVAPPTPPPPPPPLDMTPIVVGLCAAFILVAVAAAVCLMLLVPRWRRRHCPVDESQPFSVAFLSTLNEASLRERHPSGVDKALRLIERTVTREATKAGCVVAKRLEAHHMIVAKDPARALVCAAAVLRSLSAVDWARVMLTASDAELLVRVRAAQQRKRLARSESQSTTSSAQSSVVRRSIDYSVQSSAAPTLQSAGVGAGHMVPPVMAAGMWHGVGTIEQEGHGEAFGIQYGGSVTKSAAAAAMKARPWEVAMPVQSRDCAEALLWDAVGGIPGDVCDDASDSGLGVRLGLSLGSRDSSEAVKAPRKAPPQLGAGTFVAIGELNDIPPEAGGAGRAGARQKQAPVAMVSLMLSGLVDSAQPNAGLLSQSANSIRSADDGVRVKVNVEQTGNTLAAALSVDSGQLATQRVGVICVTVPALRASLPGVRVPSVELLMHKSAAFDGSLPSPDEIIAVAAGAAANSRFVALLDDCLYFAINAPDVTTAQVPARAAQDALAITSAVEDATGSLAAAGVAIGAALVGLPAATLGERDGALKTRVPPVAVLGSTAARAHTLAGVAAMHFDDSGGWPAPAGDDMESPAEHPDATVAVVEVEPARSSGDLMSTAPMVLVAGDLAAELSGFELQVVDLFAWPKSVASLLPQSDGFSSGEYSSSDVRRRLALGVRVVRDYSDAELEGNGDGEWLYSIGLVADNSPFSKCNAAVAALVKPLGVAADFAGDSLVDGDGDKAPGLDERAAPSSTSEKLIVRLRSTLKTSTMLRASLFAFAEDRFVASCLAGRR